MSFFRTDPRAFGIVVVTLVATAIAAPAASARFDLGLQQQRSVLPVAAAMRVGTAQAQSASATNVVQPNPDQQVQPRSTGVSTPKIGTPSDGFDWADAAIGAGIAGAIGLLFAGGTLAIRRRSQLAHQ